MRKKSIVPDNPQRPVPPAKGLANGDAAAPLVSQFQILVADLQCGNAAKSQHAAERLAELAHEHPANALPRLGLGIAHALLGRWEEAVAQFKRCVALDAKLPAGWSNLANVYRLQGNWKEARAAYTKAIALQPDMVDAHFNLANVLEALGNDDEAVAALRRALMFKPDYVDAHNNLGHLMQKAGKVEDAVAHFRQALAHDPKHRQAQDNLILGLYRLGRTVEGQAVVDGLLAANPADAHVLRVQAAALAQAGQLPQAQAVNQALLTMEPDAIDLQMNRGELLAQQRDFEGAMACFKALLGKPHPRPALTIRALGNVQFAQGNLTESRALMQQAQMMEPQNPALLANMGRVMLAMGDVRLAIDTLKRAVALQPESTELHAQLCMASRLQVASAPDDVEKNWAAWREAHAQKTQKMHPRNKDGGSDASRRLRVGVLVGNLEGLRHRQATLAALIEGQAAENLDLYVYQASVPGPDAAKLQAMAKHWTQVGTLGHADCTNLIRMDVLDVLVDAVGLEAGNVQVALSSRVAPLQLAWAPAADWQAAWVDGCVGDETLVSLARSLKGAAWSGVQLPMPGLWAPQGKAKTKAAGDSAPQPAEAGFVFGVVASRGWAHASALDALADLLRQVPDSRLVVQSSVSASDEQSLLRVPRLFALRDIDVDRVKVLPAGQVGSNGRLVAEIHLLLDTSLEPIGEAALDFLSQGVPVLTTMSDRYWQVQTAGVLTGLGLQDWVASDQVDWVAKAANWSQAPSAERVALARTLKRRVAASAFTDKAGFAKAWVAGIRAHVQASITADSKGTQASKRSRKKSN